MELKLLNAQGQAASNVAAADTIFGRDYNEALIHQVVIAYQANARSGNASKKTVKKFTTRRKSHGAKRYRPRSCWYVVVATVARRWSDFPNSPDENFTHKVNKKMYRAGICSILSQWLAKSA
ncbi:50S ribosomal protein L4 [Janthinobacterium agaricidamnosum]|uniref:50S ribosomal protein L4 n=1 Tax=Janthinobacterium agaricidamnosum TaxID=55508 RepID=UPI0026AEDDA7